MKCPSCSKMAAYDTSAEPELDLEVDDKGLVTGTARIVLTSKCCGDELKESTFDLEIEPGIVKHTETCVEPDFHVESESAELTERYESTKTKILKSGEIRVTQIPFRYQRHYFGVHVDVTIQCECGGKSEGSYEDEIGASSMDELV